MIDRCELGAIFIGGALGALLRAGLAEAFPVGETDWPWATFSVNIAGAALLGYWFTSLPHTTCRRPLLTTGCCGALTTFSTWMVETQRIGEAGKRRIAVANVVLSVSTLFGYSEQSRHYVAS